MSGGSILEHQLARRETIAGDGLVGIGPHRKLHAGPEGGREPQVKDNGASVSSSDVLEGRRASPCSEGLGTAEISSREARSKLDRTSERFCHFVPLIPSLHPALQWRAD